jgi:DNA repair protein RadC
MDYNTPQTKPQFVFDKTGLEDLENDINSLSDDLKVREMEVVFKGERYFFGKVESTSDVASFLRQTILKGVEVQEHFVALYLTGSNKIIGYYHHSKGTMTSTSVDIEIITAVALKSLAKGVVIAHNHPSGNTQPSDNDKRMTRRLKEALKFFDVALTDHIIITKDDYYSFQEQGDHSLQGAGGNSTTVNSLRLEILSELKKVTEANAPHLFALVNCKNGYSKVEKMVIQKVLHDGLVPAAVIPLLEMEFLL